MERAAEAEREEEARRRALEAVAEEGQQVCVGAPLEEGDLLLQVGKIGALVGAETLASTEATEQDE